MASIKKYSWAMLLEVYIFSPLFHLKKIVCGGGSLWMAMKSPARSAISGSSGMVSRWFSFFRERACLGRTGSMFSASIEYGSSSLVKEKCPVAKVLEGCFGFLYFYSSKRGPLIVFSPIRFTSD